MKANVLESTLCVALSNVLRTVWAARGVFDPGEATTMDALKVVFSEASAALFVLHYYLLKSNPKDPTKKVLDSVETEKLFTALWTQDAGQKIITMAYRIYHWVTAEDDGLKPNVTSERKLGPPDESLVKEVAMEIRAFSNLVPAALAVGIFALEQRFTWGTPDEIHRCREQGFFRLPCQNCRILLPEMDVRVGKENYDTELYSRQPDFQVA
ncbi:unnamed protein product [Clonostachys rosea]|uniref:Prion-inhibition and propagation HeLo domain-containing protein n=1 Tax=Bionectria ochroleuca TaxID=29856 RepID=A0ABY6UB24_BIOOC|nr:unnamed protein product [Clonostachys rosea]